MVKVKKVKYKAGQSKGVVIVVKRKKRKRRVGDEVQV